MDVVPGERIQGSVLIRRLSGLCPLHEAEEDALLAGLNTPSGFRRGQDIVADGSRVSSVHVLGRGMACRYRMLESGQRQIVGLVLPGDIIDFYGPVSDVADYNVIALSNCEVLGIQTTLLRSLINDWPNIRLALWRYCLMECSILQSWLINLRRRNAVERLAHLFCEQFIRLESVGLAETGHPFLFPAGQRDLADAAAMSSVHVNRTLRVLRSLHLIDFDSEHLSILDWEGLQELAQFDPGYLRSLQG